jgi:amino acid adenylation domain-containing protein
MTERTIHDVFRRRARAHPDRTALIHRGQRLSFADLDSRSDRLAVALQRQGVGPGHQVPVLLPRSPELVAVLLAVLKTGAAYAALDPQWPAARTARLIGKLDAPLIVADDRAGAAPGPRRWPPEPAGGALRPVQVGAADPGTVFFTSGSTGEPKGVLVTHAGTVGLFEHWDELGPDTVMPQAAALPWDAMTLELWGPLLAGGTVVLVDEPYLTPPLLRALVAGAGVNTAWLTAAIFNLAVDEDPRCFAGLRRVLVGGERLSVRHVAAFLAEHPGIRLVNGYGPVECTVFVTTHRIRSADLADPDGIPVGRAVPGTRVMVLDGERMCAPGELGEICVAGERLAVEYLGDPEGTAEKFVRVPLPSGPTRVYRTGDRGRMSPAGLLSVLGRVDRQVKLRGHRVEPAEVEHAMMTVPGVLRAAVEPQRDPDGAVTGLVGFYTALDGLDPEPLRAALRDRLPGYLVPGDLRGVADFPYTASGKVDHAALARLGSVARARTGPATAAGAESHAGAEAHAAAVFGELLGIGEVPPDDSFFALGGDSLDAGRACVRLGERLGRMVPLSSFMRDPTVRGLAAALSARVEGPAPEPGALTPWQRPWLIDRSLRPDDGSGHCPMLWWITGPVDPAALAAALSDVHRRHASLRTRYRFDGGAPVSTVDDIGDLDGPALQVLPDGADPAAVEASVLAELDRRLDLAAGRVWRAVLCRCPTDGRSLFGLVVHHIAFDGGSEAVLAADLSRAYRARAAGAAPDFPPAPTNDPEPSAVDLAAQESFWRTAMARVRPLELPVDPRPVTGRDRMALSGFELDPETWQRLLKTGRQAGATVTVLALVAWARVLRDATGHADFGIGLPVDKRVTAAMTDAVGCFVGMVCVPAIDLIGVDLGQAAAAVRAVLAAQDVPLSEVVRMSGRPSAPYQTIVAVQQHDPPDLRLPGCQVVHARPAPPEPICDLQVEIWADAGRPARALLTSDAGRVPDWFAATLVDAYRTTLAGLS